MVGPVEGRPGVVIAMQTDGSSRTGHGNPLDEDVLLRVAQAECVAFLDLVGRNEFLHGSKFRWLVTGSAQEGIEARPG